MPLTAEQLGEAVDELRFQDKRNGLPEEHISATIQRVTAMGPVKAQMLAIKAIWDSIELGKEWARTPEGIARQIGRAASALQHRREAVGRPISTIAAVQRVTPEVEQLAGIRDVAGNMVANRPAPAAPTRTDGTAFGFASVATPRR